VLEDETDGSPAIGRQRVTTQSGQVVLANPKAALLGPLETADQ